MNSNNKSKSNVFGDMPAEEFKEHGYKMIDWIAEYLTDIEKFPVIPDIKPGDIKNKLPKNPPRTSDSFEKILADIDEKIIPGVTHWNHPNFMAYFNSKTNNSVSCIELLKGIYNATKQNKQEFG